MKNIQWSNYDLRAPNDGKYTDPDNLGAYTFPGYLMHPDFPLIPLHVLTIDETNNWCRGDEPSLYEKNLKKRGPNWHYANKKIEYIVNTNGYRAPEWKDIDWKNAIVLLGCSMTFGVGVDENETISYFLQKKTGRPVINLGHPAASNELIFNNAVSVFENFDTPYAVVMNWSCLDRFLYYSNYFHDIGLWTNEKDEDDGINLFELYKQLNFNIYNMPMKSYFVSKACRNLFKDRTKYYSMRFFKSSAHIMRADWHFLPDTEARDLAHPGVKSNEIVAKHLYEILK